MSAERIREIADEMAELLKEAKDLAKETLSGGEYQRFNEYVFKQISEHINKGNPYNVDMSDLADSVETFEEEFEDEEV